MLNAPPRSVVLTLKRAVAVGVRESERVVLDEGVEVQRLWVAILRVWYGGWFRRPVRRHEPAETAAVVPSTEHIEVGLAVARADSFASVFRYPDAYSWRPTLEEQADIQGGRGIMIRPFLLIVTILTATGPALAQKTSLMEEENFKSFLAKLHQDSKDWIHTVSSIDIASIPGAKVAARRQQACLHILNKLQDQTNALTSKNSFRNQVAVLYGLTEAESCLSAFQDTLNFRDKAGLGEVASLEKWERWQDDLTRAFEAATTDETKMFEHMSALAEIVDSKIDVGSLRKVDSNPAKSQ